MSNARRITILDGGMGHELKLRGISDGTFLAGVLANDPDDSISCANSNSAIVEPIHFDYLIAGCDVITTNSFVAVRKTISLIYAMSLSLPLPLFPDIWR